MQPGSAAAKLGVVAGCRLISVNGESTKGMTTKDVTGMLKAAMERGEARKLKFARAPA